MPLHECARQLDASASTMKRRSAAAIPSTLRFQPCSKVVRWKSSIASSPRRCLTYVIAAASPSTSRSCMNCHSCFISSHSLRAASVSPRSSASIARSIVGRDISPSSSSLNQRSLVPLLLMPLLPRVGRAA